LWGDLFGEDGGGGGWGIGIGVVRGRLGCFVIRGIWIWACFIIFIIGMVFSLFFYGFLGPHFFNYQTQIPSSI
jgi:hypothetical protein